MTRTVFTPIELFTTIRLYLKPAFFIEKFQFSTGWVVLQRPNLGLRRTNIIYPIEALASTNG